MKYKSRSTKCSGGCGRERRPGQRMCLVCHRADMKLRRILRRLKPSDDSLLMSLYETARRGVQA